ncbi:MAG: hypothetical protein A2092_15775 [Rhodobacteraceae bacterium GWE1_64_9]|nr:MAG: hypothetical protein A2092_15775 [Rhodobacteraceae bacterium GWE1_64_9]OHC50109.1 MAG: hypothetical protein A2X69_01835 [Rhodobacteraceae bacterium GWF1_65_7]HBD90229.1 hypothetical protein [Gemmobacter sp.]HBU15208.1 hypothetical protein [Gemmobacter sp.]
MTDTLPDATQDLAARLSVWVRENADRLHLVQGFHYAEAKTHLVRDYALAPGQRTIWTQQETEAVGYCACTRAMQNKIEEYKLQIALEEIKLTEGVV